MVDYTRISSCQPRNHWYQKWHFTIIVKVPAQVEGSSLALGISTLDETFSSQHTIHNKLQAMQMHRDLRWQLSFTCYLKRQ
jgi:hypothetical protein